VQCGDEEEIRGEETRSKGKKEREKGKTGSRRKRCRKKDEGRR
jgi:hypothetical protein